MAQRASIGAVVVLLACAGGAVALELDPTGQRDSTNALQALLDGTSKTLLTGSANITQGGAVQLPTGKFRVGGVGAIAHCAGGPHAGATCTDDAECGAQTSTETREGYCAWLVIPRPTVLEGTGIGTELLVIQKAGRTVHALAIAPLAPYSRIARLHLSGWPKRTGGTKGIVLLARYAVLSNITIDGLGGDGLFADGALGKFSANNFRFEDLEANDGGGDGVHVVSHTPQGAPSLPPSGVGDGSQGVMTNVSALGNAGAGFNLRSSKGTLIGLKAIGNASAGLRLRGSYNVGSLYGEIKDKPVMLFEAESRGNIVMDSSNAAQTTGTYVDRGTLNHYWSGGRLWP